MPAAAALPLFWGAVGAGVTGATGLIAAKMQSGAAREGADAQIAAANHAADLQKQEAEEALAFQRSQAENAYQNTEVSRRGNYDQWAAAQRRLGSVGALLGMGPREIPNYVPGVDPNFGGAPTPPPGGPTAPPPPGGPAAAGVPSRPADLAAALDVANKVAYGGQQKHTDPGYWQALWAKDPDYAFKRMLGWQAGGADAATSGPYAAMTGGATSTPNQPRSIASLLAPSYASAPYMTPTITPALMAPNPYSVGNYLAGA